MEVRLGFTGTQAGMTARQKQEFERLILQLQPRVFNHGDCIGADAEADAIVKRLFPYCKIQIYPCNIDAKRAWCIGDVVFPPAPPLQRNKNIVRASMQLIATPKEAVEQLRSGTWSTIRYARGQMKVQIIDP